ncbi:MAG: HlyD family efflux transporter periplasmic adaptor subunit, partial [SAR324 cluster bacterium]|nr:HlyD family efflux transporter periplasmic adaptor subunit [SAR324 cluster bacterium]
TVRELESNVAQTQYELKLELGRQAVAKREYELLGESLRVQDLELVLRAPQLNAARAAEQAADAALERARLNLQRTRVAAPFNAVVQKKLVGIGSQVAAGTALATLVDSDEYWVEVSVPTDRVRWINIPASSSETGSSVRIRHDAAWSPGAFRKGTVVRLMTDLEPEGRMARLVVVVNDPFSLREENLRQPRLTLGAYVRVEIEGKMLPQVARIPRSTLREGNRVWVMTEDRTLDFREVKILWNESDHVFIANKLGKNEFLITSDFAAPVRGMRLQTTGGDPAAPPSRPLTQAKATGER